MGMSLAEGVLDRYIRSLIEVRQSPIHGLGVFARQPVSKGTYLPDNLPPDAYAVLEVGEPGWNNMSAIMRPDGKILSHQQTYGTSWQDHLNHSNTPNVEFRTMGRGLDLYTLRAIVPGEELTLDYRRHVHPADKDRYIGLV